MWPHLVGPQARREIDIRVVQVHLPIIHVLQGLLVVLPAAQASLERYHIAEAQHLHDMGGEDAAITGAANGHDLAFAAAGAWSLGGEWGSSAAEWEYAVRAGTTPIALVHRDGVFTAISGA